MTQDHLPYGGHAPFVAGSDTSEAAAKSIDCSAESIRAQVMKMIADSRNIGLTCDEIEKRTDWRHQTVSARIRELSLMEKIKDSGDRRKTRSGRTARIYVAA